MRIETRGGIGAFEGLSPKERREKLLDPSFLPSMAQMVSAFTDIEDEFSDDNPWANFLLFTSYHDFINAEYVDTLASYLKSRAIHLGVKPKEQFTVLEVGAGNGRLAHFLRSRLNPNLATYIAIDSPEGRISPIFSEEPMGRLDYKDALLKYHPDIVICEWMPYRKDWTATIRAHQAVKEYILIGETDSGCCGDPWETWGNTYFNERLAGEIPQYVKDGFRRVDLKGNTWLHLCHSDGSPTEPIHSRTVSFRRL